jgi:uncharacterized protein
VTPQRKEDLARKFLTVLSHPDADVIKDVATEDVIWSFPGGSPISGEAHGVDEIVKRGKTISSYGVNVEVLKTIYSFSGVAILLHNTADRAGKVLDEQVAAVFSFGNDKVARLDTFLSNVAMAEAFFS